MTESYSNLFRNISDLIEQGRMAAVRQINTVLVATYWLTGQRIVEFEQSGKEKAAYGEMLIKNLSVDLRKRFGKGWGENLLCDIRQFYLVYRGTEIPHTVCGESNPGMDHSMRPKDLEAFQSLLPLSWSHYRLLMRIEDAPKRTFYERLTIQNHWSVRQMDREINSLLFERTALSRRKDIVLARANEHPIAVKPEDEIKDTYVLEFLGLNNEYSESDLEEALVKHIEKFLLELGRGFAFVGRQMRFQLGGDEYRIDLLLYHIGYARYFLLELKIGKFEHAHIGQINFYLNWVKDNIWPRGQNEPVGIIMCSDKNNATVRYATGGLNNQIFVSQYLLDLPKSEELQRELERGRELFLQSQVAHKGGVGRAE
jgi:predicted nuclease of restriction endonuclease-like (RecB) superfamily